MSTYLCFNCGKQNTFKGNYCYDCGKAMPENMEQTVYSCKVKGKNHERKPKECRNTIGAVCYSYQINGI